MDLSSAAHELYGVAPEEFTATRTRLVREARAAGDAALARRIGALRRPTLPAWAVNLLAREAGEELGRLLDVGADLRGAWSSGGGIGGLEQRRGELVALLVRRARELAEGAGHPLRDTAVRDVEDTLQAATVEAEVADEVRQGRLTQPRSHTGFVPAGFPGTGGRPEEEPAEEPQEPQEQEEPPAAPGRGPGRAERERAGRKKAHAAARRRAEQAERAERDLADHEAKVSEAREELERADAEAGRLRRELDRAIARQETAARRLEQAELGRDTALRAARNARREAEGMAPGTRRKHG
ncbi:hypothetical protein ACFY4C_34250 [Actinomadura viridis]|uniref:hypothetical protein n=1 Tax=Actinomadura viridis TaxID=58110 RepID=UPI0036C111B5